MTKPNKNSRFNHRVSTNALILILLIAASLTGCASQKIIVPPVTNSAAGIHLPGKFVWFDLFTTDMTAASNFYDALFNWDFERTNEDNPAVKTIFHKGSPIATMIGRNGEPGNSQWLSYMSVEDVDAAIQIALNNGGSVYRPARELPNRGRIAVILDPQKAAVALLTSSTGDPGDSAFVSNRWLESELWTRNVNDAVNFYQKLAGYDVSLVDVHETMQYRLLTQKGKQRGGVVEIRWDDVKPEWVPYIAVKNILETVTKAQKLGGSVLLPPDMSVKEGHVAIIADPTGAVFGVQQLR
ncbi:MAG: VOC family protein [Pseudodesulfovibrio sp.]|nr:VOC family protein [Pseudodesulfovibrio sp.]